ncbi:MAG: TauD/TfdA family dioxygenase [Burkholderiales bacterium]|nr:TauD/TfdA family dioxygenase [Burkholderiales bacterium]
MQPSSETFPPPRSGIRVRRLSEHIGAEIENIDLSRPISSAQFADINTLLVRHSVLVFRGQDLPPAMHVDFASRFGRLVGHIVKRFSVDDYPEVTYISNVRNDKGEMIGADRAGMIWHSDMSYLPRPMLGSMLYGVECPPEGADTEFASMFAAHDALPDSMRALLAGAKGVHDYAWHYATYLSHRKPLTDEEKAQAPPVSHPALRTHPESGRKAIYVSEGLTRTLDGMEEAEGRRLVVEASEFATQPQFVYRHKWRSGDLVFWDNRSTMHRATEFDNRYRRLMRRTTVEGDIPA